MYFTQLFFLQWKTSILQNENTFRIFFQMSQIKAYLPVVRRTPHPPPPPPPHKPYTNISRDMSCPICHALWSLLLVHYNAVCEKKTAKYVYWHFDNLLGMSKRSKLLQQITMTNSRLNTEHQKPDYNDHLFTIL